MKKYKKLIMIMRIMKMKLLLRLKINRKYRFKDCRFEKMSK